jgi:hypothetical protein
MALGTSHVMVNNDFAPEVWYDQVMLAYRTKAGQLFDIPPPGSRVMDGLYGAKWPRSIAARIRRMDQLMAWKVKQWKRRTERRLWFAAGVAVGTPAALIVLTLLWQTAVKLIVG